MKKPLGPRPCQDPRQHTRYNESALFLVKHTDKHHCVLMHMKTESMLQYFGVSGAVGSCLPEAAAGDCMA